MKRPFCVLCVGILGAQIAAIVLPQMVFWPSAAFFALLCLGTLALCPRGRGFALTLLLGAGLGLALLGRTRSELDGLNRRFEGRTLRLEACVQQVQPGYSPRTVQAELRVEKANGEEVSFCCWCAELPACAVGDRIAARFRLEAPSPGDRLSRYADGQAFEADYEEGFVLTGQDESLRARGWQLQQALSGAIRRFLDEDTGGVLAAMTVGDRGWISDELNAAYRAAGLSHVLVVSGMHAAILCGGLFRARTGREKQRKLWHSRVRAAISAGMALLLAAVTGFTPSVIRAGVSLWISALGVWLFAPADAVTSLAAAGLFITLPNSYAVCDVGAELSFAAVLGTLAGAEVSRRGLALWQRRKRRRRLPPRLSRWAGRGLSALWDAACISACASAATFPVLVLRGMSASLYSLVSGVAVLWMVKPILLCGLGAALTRLLPVLKPVQMAFSFGGGLLVFCLNGWARMAEGWPGAQLYFETGYAALLCLILMGLCLLAARWKVRLRVAVPAVLLVAGAGVAFGNALSRDVIRVSLAGGGLIPSVVVSQNGGAVVLYRGGAAGEQAVESQLARVGAEKIDLLIDLRLSPESPCGLEAEEMVSAAGMADYETLRLWSGEIGAEVFRTPSGCAVRLTVGGRSLAAVSGAFQLARPVEVDYLLASPSAPDAFRWEAALTLRTDYSWMAGQEIPAHSSLALRPKGGERLR